MLARVWKFESSSGQPIKHRASGDVLNILIPHDMFNTSIFRFVKSLKSFITSSATGVQIIRNISLPGISLNFSSIALIECAR